MNNDGVRSRLLARLAEEARTATDPSTWAKATCRIASHHGRQGRTEKAMQAIGAVRSRFGNDLTPSVGAWLMLAEGVMHFFQDRLDEANERTRRAYAIAVAARLDEVRPACAAWMAHLDFNSMRFEEMALHLEEALSDGKADDHQTQARAALVLADALHFAGDFSAARPWYEKTRIHATTEGDEATLSALLHNVAAFRIGNVRIADALGEAAPGESKRAMMEANSALHFDEGIGTESLSMLLPLIRGQLLTVEKKYAQAEAMLAGIDRQKLDPQRVPMLLVDLAWCCAAQDRLDAGAALASEAASLLSASTDIDEAVCIHARLAQIAERRGQSAQAQCFREASKVAYAEYSRQRAALRQRLAALSSRPRQAGSSP